MFVRVIRVPKVGPAEEERLRDRTVSRTARKTKLGRGVIVMVETGERGSSMKESRFVLFCIMMVGAALEYTSWLCRTHTNRNA